MKRQRLLGIVTLFAATAFLAMLQVWRHKIENSVLHGVTIDGNLLDVASYLCLTQKIPVAIEGIQYDFGQNRISFSAPKARVRDILDAVVPREFIWNVHSGFIHIIARSLVSKSDYQLNARIAHFSAKAEERDALFKSVLAEARKSRSLQPLDFAEIPYAEFGLKMDRPKISIDMNDVSVREILDQVSLKTNSCYYVLQGKNPESQVIGITEDLPTGLRSIPEREKPSTKRFFRE